MMNKKIKCVRDVWDNTTKSWKIEKINVDSNVSNLMIDNSKLNKNTKQILLRAEIKTIGKLMTYREEHLKAIKGISEGRLLDLIEKLEELGVGLGFHRETTQ